MVHGSTRRHRPPVGALFLMLAMLPADARAQVSAALVDHQLTVGAGATLAVGAGDLVATLESRVVPHRLVDERGAGRRTANIAYRTAKLLLFDRPQESWLMVANHEVFGHGGRVRERFGGYLRFGLDAPAPYGNGGGVTVYQPDRDVTFHELQAVSVGGMEANGVGAALLAARALDERRLAPRAALRYLLFELDAFDYIQNTGDEAERDGHDVSDFLGRYNLLADYVGADTLSARTLRRQSWVSLANPMVASAIYSIGRYLVTGSDDGRVFALPIGSWSVMPGMRYRLTPFGTEFAVATEVVGGDAAGRLNVRVGRAPFTRPWAVDAFVQAWQLSGWSIGVGSGIWRQPPLALDDDDFGVARIGDELEWGGDIRGRVESPIIRLWQRPTAATLIIEASVKSRGFVPGEPLDGGLVFRAGLGLPLGRH